MGKLLATTALVSLLSTGVAMAGCQAPPPSPISTPGHFTFLLGLGVEFGDGQPDLGVTGKVLVAPISNFVAGGGATWFPGSGKVGLDLSAGLNLNGIAALGGYDFLTNRPQVSVGYAPVFNTLSCPQYFQLNGDHCEVIAGSDRRLKRDIVHVATLSDGIKLYSFRYLWSDTSHVGVMAQDLLEDPRYAHAVSTGDDGFYRVDYDQLDLVMVTLEQWNEFGLDAVVLGERPAELWTDQAA